MSASNLPDQALVKLVQMLVAIPSISGEERAVQDYIASWLTDASISTRIDPAEGGLFNVVAEVQGLAGDGPVLWIGGHCDTVSVARDWTHDPHDPIIMDGRLYGLGAMDMKGGLAAAMFALRDLYQRREEWGGRVIFAALADEEAFSRGANAHVLDLPHVDAAIMCEPHFHDVVIGAMGKANIAVTVTGRSAHGSRPEEGVNAVTEAARLIAAIGTMARPQHPDHGAATHCVLEVASGDGRYEIRVPDHCAFRINWHFMPGETIEDGVAALRGLVDGLQSPAQFDISVGAPLYESYQLAEDSAFLAQFADSYRRVLGAAPDLRFGRGVSDANILAGRAGIPTLLFGPSGANMHAGDEWVDLDQLHLAKEVYLDFALHFLAPASERFSS